MLRKQLIALINEGENLNIEFKLKFSSAERIAKEMIAFANTKGGNIIFGIDDDKNIVGVQSEKGEAELIKEAAEKYCEPPIHFKLHYIELYGKEIVVAEITESRDKPHRIQDYLPEIDINISQVYVRINDKSVPASKEMIKLFKSGSKSLHKYKIGSIEERTFSFLDKNEMITVQQLAELCNISQRRASRAIINLVRAGMLLIHTKDNGENFYTSAI
ncbi:MAG: putative DNA binding domain-containing protein [Ignavibacteria bacterium]|nr:putative DNA binding domain-containing protein [Ignavibacteria bacterium]